MRVLLVEDDQNTARVIEMALNAEGFNVGSAAGGDYEPVGFTLLLAVAVASRVLASFDLTNQR